MTYLLTASDTLRGVAWISVFLGGCLTLSTACARLLDVCTTKNCRRAFAWRRRALDNGQSSPVCRRCANQVDRMRNTVAAHRAAQHFRERGVH